MFTVTENSQSDYRIKGSKFLGYIFPAAGLSDAEKALQFVKNEHPTATHHCFAYVIHPNEPIEFAHDDGEPGGTAGLPILNAIRSSELVNVVLIVVRYFGGTKLGKAGLIDAYGQTAAQTIREAALKKIIPIQTYAIEYDYKHQGYIDKVKNDFNWIELDAVYLETVKMVCGCPIPDKSRFEASISSFSHLLREFTIKEKSFHIIRINI